MAELNATEHPLLVNPTGPQGEDPEPLLRFEGVLAAPRATSGHANLRARTIIALFGLNEREELLRDRFATIERVWLNFEKSRTGSGEPRAIAEKRWSQLQSAESAQTACARAFAQLCETRPARAWQYYRYAVEYSPKAPRL
ncbi:MAG: hypothetical protein GY711_05980 [bacterium]|nr:hypothetical protein [bacterium]